MDKRQIKITDTAFRDAHQSLLATRMRTEDMLAIAEKVNQVGYWSVEMWGGATFDSCLRFLKQDPWERIRLLKKAMPNTRLQMLLRGQNIVGYRHYPDDVVKKFVEQAHKNGIDVFRIFDALNDPRNMKTALDTTKKVGALAECCVCYTISPVHTTDVFVNMAKELEAMGSDTLCIKDMAGLLSPSSAFELVTKLKENISLPIHLHCHDTSGMATAAYLKGIEAGADIIDCAISSLSRGTSQPPTETFVAMLKGTPYDTDLDLTVLGEIADHFTKVRKKYRIYESSATGVDTDVLQFQIPGGMMSNLVKQLRDQNAEDRLPEVLKEVPKVRAELGYPPLVTPSSQIVGTQATLNVLLSGRYKMIPKETKNLVRGLYGKSAAPIAEQVKIMAIGDEVPITSRPADLLEPELEKLKKELGTENIEDVLSYALFPQVAKRYFLEREGKVIDDAEVAAISVALASKFLRIETVTQPRVMERRNEISPWGMAGRIELMNARGRNP
ncbi:MAG: pyruvate/oxaloacetate carboxyltransferase [Thermoplasmata archaeon]|nr:MAG: pyruvate/oxaloacetate carboxyltransferase [Thermoplasmata archaeon]